MARENVFKYIEYTCILLTVILIIVMNLAQKIFPYILIIFAMGMVIFSLKILRYQSLQQFAKARTYVIIVIIYIIALAYLFPNIF
ncbi:MAG: hypothetical protein ACOWWO_02590 [Peptococcaceae bacterium]